MHLTVRSLFFVATTILSCCLRSLDLKHAKSWQAGKSITVTNTMSARVANVNVPVAAKFHHRDLRGIGE
jgi:hypothetical protein